MAKEVADINDVLTEFARSAPKRSAPGGWYSPEGDSVFCYNEDVPYRAVRVDDLLTIYRAEDDKRIVGVQIKGIKDLPKHDLLGIQVEKKEIEVVTLMLVTFKRQEAPKEQTPSREKLYLDACTSMVGRRIPARELQLN